MRYRVALVCAVLASILLGLDILFAVLSGREISGRQFLVWIALMFAVLLGWSLIPSLKRRFAPKQPKPSHRYAKRIR